MSLSQSLYLSIYFSSLSLSLSLCVSLSVCVSLNLSIYLSISLSLSLYLSLSLSLSHSLSLTHSMSPLSLSLFNFFPLTKRSQFFFILLTMFLFYCMSVCLFFRNTMSLSNMVIEQTVSLFCSFSSFFSFFFNRQQLTIVSHYNFIYNYFFPCLAFPSNPPIFLLSQQDKRMSISHFIDFISSIPVQT